MVRQAMNSICKLCIRVCELIIEDMQESNQHISCTSFVGLVPTNLYITTVQKDV